MASQAPPAKKLKLSEDKDKKEPCTPCQFRDKMSAADFACTKCVNYFLCKSCKLKHNQNANTKDHAVVPLGDQDTEQITFCTKHPGRNRKYLCVQCDQSICDVCIDIEHGDHNLKSIERIKKEISDAMEPLIASESDDINQEMNALKSSEDSIIKKVESHAESLKQRLMAEIDSKKVQIVSEIKKRGYTENAEALVKQRGLLSEVLRQGEGVLSSKVENLVQYKALKSSRKALEQASADNTRLIEILRQKRKSFETATFVPSKTKIDGGIHVGDFVIAPEVNTEEEIFTLISLGSWTCVLCCEIGRAVIQEDGIAFLSRQPGKMEHIRFIDSTVEPSLLMKTVSCPDAANMLDAIDHIDVISSAHNVISFSIPDTENASMLPPGWNCGGNFCAETKEGDTWVVVETDRNNLRVHLRRGTVFYENIIASLKIPNLARPVASTSIGWIMWLDMLLVHDVHTGEVLAYTLEVKNEIRKNLPLTLKYSLEKRPSLSSPLPGFYIVETYCTGNLVYLYLKKGNPGDETIEAGPIKIYEAQYIDNQWKLASLRLVKADGQELCSLEEDQQMKIAANEDNLLCLVYKPDPIGPTKVGAVPRMKVTIYVGTKLFIESIENL